MIASFTYAQLYQSLSRSLSIIGKRATDDKGNRLFEDITLGSREEGIAYDYFSQAAIDITTAIADVVKGFSNTNDGFTISIKLSNETLATAVRNAIEDYCVSHALYSWFTVTAPTISERYLNDRSRRMGTILTMVYTKRATYDDNN